MAIRITIEAIDEEHERDVLHNDYRRVERGQTVEKTVRFMLELAGEKFSKAEELKMRAVD